MHQTIKQQARYWGKEYLGIIRICCGSIFMKFVGTPHPAIYTLYEIISIIFIEHINEKDIYATLRTLWINKHACTELIVSIIKSSYKSTMFLSHEPVKIEKPQKSTPTNSFYLKFNGKLMKLSIQKKWCNVMAVQTDLLISRHRLHNRKI